jgi:hypothetical protein
VALGVGRWLELFGADVGTEFVFESHRTQFAGVFRPRWPWKEFKLLRWRKGLRAQHGQVHLGQYGQIAWSKDIETRIDAAYKEITGQAAAASHARG